MESTNHPCPAPYRPASVNGLDVFYRQAGPDNGPVVLLLHGFPSSSRMFRDLIPRLSDAYRVIAPDYPAFGHSAVPGAPRDDPDPAGLTEPQNKNGAAPDECAPGHARQDK